MKKNTVDPIEEIKDMIKKQLILSLFAFNVPQGEIAKKLKTDITTVNGFLKGIKKNS